MYPTRNKHVFLQYGFNSTLFSKIRWANQKLFGENWFCTVSWKLHILENLFFRKVVIILHSNTFTRLQSLKMINLYMQIQKNVSFDAYLCTFFQKLSILHSCSLFLQQASVCDGCQKTIIKTYFGLFLSSDRIITMVEKE